VRSRSAEEGALEPGVAAAYAACARIVRRSGSSFAAAFWMLPAERRRALHAVYAFCRLADDIADDPQVRADRSLLVTRWRNELEAAYRAKSEHPVGIALAHAVQRFRLPEEPFLELLEGVESDLRGEPIADWDDLRLYCHRVASTVGLLVVRLLGCRDARALAWADAQGVAVQLVNVLRDVGDDAASGRIYLPESELRRFDVSRDEVLGRRRSDRMRLLLASVGEHARLEFERADRLFPVHERARLRPARAMGAIYRALLGELQRRGWPCLETPLRLSRSRRLAIAAGTWVGLEPGP